MGHWHVDDEQNTDVDIISYYTLFHKMYFSCLYFRKRISLITNNLLNLFSIDSNALKD
jgi:hypothetical protein